MQSLLIVGASARAAAQSARRAGFDVATVDMFADADLREIATAMVVRRYPHGLVAVMNQLPPGPWMYTGALENYPGLVDRLAKSRPLLGVAGKNLDEVRNPWIVAETLRNAELPYAACHCESHPPPADGTWLIKPRRSAGGMGILPWEENCAAAIKDHYFQSRIEGRPVAAVFVGNSKDAVLLGITEQIIGATWLNAGGFQYCGSIGPLAIPQSIVAQCRQIGETLCRRFGLSGLFGVDAILTNEHFVPVEINPRYPASVEIIERAHAWSAVQLHVRACRDKRIPNGPELIVNPDVQDSFGKAILYAPRHLKINQSTQDMLMDRRGDALLLNIADIPAAGSEIPEKRPILTIFAKSTSRDNVVSQLREYAAELYDALT